MSRFCKACPARFTSRPTEPCPRALERIHAIQAEGPKSKVDPETLPGCPWAINSAQHNYCFWNLAAELQDDPRSDREICNMLMISQQTLEKTLASALEKLAALKGTQDMDDFVEAVREHAAAQPDDTAYLPDGYAKILVQPTPEEPEEDEDAKLAEDATKKPRKGYGMPMHKSGDKVDLYGLYGKKKLQAMLEKKRQEKK